MIARQSEIGRQGDDHYGWREGENSALIKRGGNREREREKKQERKRENEFMRANRAMVKCMSTMGKGERVQCSTHEKRERG